MKQVTLLPINEIAEIPTHTTLLDPILAKQCTVAMACGGQGICATCHVFVNDGHEALSPKTERERKTLALISTTRPESRLACQARVLDQGVVVRLPEGMYLERVADLESMIGRRTEVPILHPLDGRILVDKGKIMTRSRLQELKSVEDALQQLRASAGTA